MADMVVVDDFSGSDSHGDQVVNSALDEYPNITIDTVDINNYSGTEEALEDAPSNSYTINVSRSLIADHYNEPLVEDTNRIGDECKRRLENNQLVVFSAGNHDEYSINPWKAPSYNIVVGGHDNNGNMYDPTTFHHQAVGFWALAESPSGSFGTSFSAPRVAAAFADVMKRTGANPSEAMTIYERAGDKDEFLDSDIPDGDAWVVKLDSDTMKNVDSVLDPSRWILIEACYRAFLGRQPDADGVDYYEHYSDPVYQMVEDSINNGSINQDKVPLMQRVNATYKLILHQEPDSGYPVAYWLSRIDDPDGTSSDIPSWQDFVQAIVNAAQDAGKAIHHKDEIDRFLSLNKQHIGYG